MYKIKMEAFEGPLDLLLQLIEDQKMDITQLSLAGVTEQFIRHLEQVQEKNESELADFLVVAAKLVYIKSKALLPFLIVQEEDEEAEELERQLKIYKEYLVAAEKIQKMIKKGKFSYTRKKLLVKNAELFNPPKTLTTAKMKNIFKSILFHLEKSSPIYLPQALIKKTINIEDRISHIKNLILDKASVSFCDLLKNSRDKAEIVVSFLALLELVKQRIIFVRQDNHFGDIRMERADKIES